MQYLLMALTCPAADSPAGAGDCPRSNGGARGANSLPLCSPACTLPSELMVGRSQFAVECASEKHLRQEAIGASVAVGVQVELKWESD